MVQVFVNGPQVLKNGEHTGAKPGRAWAGMEWEALIRGGLLRSLHPQ